MKSLPLATLSTTLSLLSLTHAAEPADTILTGGKVYTLDSEQPWAEALAVKDGKFLTVGTRADVEAVTGDGTEVIDLGGRFVMPEHLKELGMVEDGLYFHGAGKFFFVWNPEELSRMGPAFRGAQASCRAQMAKAEAKAKGAKK